MSPRLLPPMHSTVKRLAVLGALGATLGIVAPVASASEAGTPAAPATLAALGFPGPVAFDPGAVVNGQGLGSAVTGAIIITTAPTSFINTNNQTSPVGNVSVGQVAP
jgi:hypothetical protein